MLAALVTAALCLGAQSPAPAGDLAVRVHHAGGAPASGATVLLHDGTRLLDHATTDAQGSARLARPTREAELCVVGASWRPLRTPVAADAERLDLALGEGAEVTGRVVLDADTVLDGPLRVWLSTSEPASDDAWLLELPREVQDLLLEPAPQPCAQAVAADGSFRFSGLPADWRGSVHVPERYTLAHGLSFREDVRAGDEVQLTLGESPALTGFVLGPDGARVQGASVAVRLRLEERWGRPRPDGRDVPRPGEIRASGTTDAQGRFRVTLSQLVWSGPDGHEYFDRLIDFAGGIAAELAVEIRAPDGLVWRLVLPDTDLSRGRELGTVHLARCRDVRLDARDEGGRPVAGAIAFYGLDLETKSEPTGANGQATIEGLACASAPSELWVWAPYRRAQRALPSADPDAPLAVVLPKAAVLEVQLDAALLAQRPEVAIQVGGLQLFGEPVDGRACSVLERERKRLCAGTERQTGTNLLTSNGVQTATRTTRFAPDAEGRVVVPDVAPSVPIRVGLLADDHELESAQLELAPGERRVVSFPQR
jgi:hypothetical protein